MLQSLALGLLLLLPLFSCAQEPYVEPAAPGPFLHPSAEELAKVATYKADQPIVGTYLFYWYDVYSGAHLIDGDGTDACTTHPPSWDDFSYHSTRWWRQQLTDIAAAGIDFAAPVYWGYPNGYDEWSFQGLPNLVRACDYMARVGEACPKIGLFYDTSTLAWNRFHQHVDLSTDEGKSWFYCTIRDYFSFIPPRHWAAIEGRPIILLYAAAFAAKQDPALFPYVRKRFREDFGVDPYLIKQTSWEGEADSTCNWGGALGLQMAGCAALGPGYDHSAVPGRTPLVREREEGAFYSRSWETVLRYRPARRPRLVMVETWNEFHEGTDVAESREYGRKYIDLTRKYADLFHANEQLAALSGAYSDAKSLTADFAKGREDGGVKVPSSGDGVTQETEIGGRRCVQSAASEHPSKYVYFDLDESFAFDLEPQPITVEVTYYDGGCASFALEYDSQDPDGSVREGAFKHAGVTAIGNTGEWKTATFRIEDARFANRTNGSDFRLAVGGPGELSIAGVKVTKG